MAGPSRRRRRSESVDDASSDASESPKRRRTLSTVATTHTNGTTVDMNAFQPGAIVRVTVENFVTYEKAEFFPGPYLNMVIGPNGTGKSSLVCAICLGLGYGPKHLGRAGSVKEFVKHGKDTATIEIELQKRPNDRRNHIIKMQIRREQNSQKWWINGKETTAKNIQELMRTLKIQVDNLCQFLPQDRVVEFAACTPVNLLHETLRAAAPEEMLQWQSQLQELHKTKKIATEGTQADTETLQNLETRQQGLQADVDRLREREEIQTRVENLESALVLCKYQEARQKHTEARERKKIAERSLRRLEQETGPSLEAVNKKQVYAENIAEALADKEKELDDAHVTTRKRIRDVVRAAEKVGDMADKLEGERKDFEAKKKEVAASRLRITNMRAELSNKPADFNGAEWNQKIVSDEIAIK